MGALVQWEPGNAKTDTLPMSEARCQAKVRDDLQGRGRARIVDSRAGRRMMGLNLDLACEYSPRTRER